MEAVRKYTRYAVLMVCFLLVGNTVLAQDISDEDIFDNEIKGQLQPVTYAEISAKMTGEIEKINVKESHSFKKGDKLVEFDCDMERAELKKAKAVHKADLARKSVNNRLDKLSSISELEVKVALYKAEESAAEVEAIEQRIKYCVMKAPYDGVVEETHRQPHEYVTKGDPVLKILDDTILEIELLVPSQWVTKVKEGEEFKVHVAELNKTFQAKISSIGAKIDPVSQSMKVKGRIDNQSKMLRPGMSVTATFE